MIRDGMRARLAESVNLALAHGEGAIIVVIFEPGAPTTAASGDNPLVPQEALYSTLNACPSCKVSYAELEPRSFSFNSPYGACPECEGLGSKMQFDPDLLLPDGSLSLAGGAVAVWKGAAASKQHEAQLASLASAANVSIDTPLDDYSPKAPDALLHGDAKHHGLLTLLEQEYVTATEPATREHLERFRAAMACPACGGARLNPSARACKLQGRAIHEIAALTVREAGRFFQQLAFSDEQQPIGTPIVAEIGKRLDFLDRVGVDYLTLDRAADTLSGGELQRVRLATGIGSGLVGVCYVLDEPSIGLHPRDNQRLIRRACAICRSRATRCWSWSMTTRSCGRPII